MTKSTILVTSTSFRLITGFFKVFLPFISLIVVFLFLIVGTDLSNSGSELFYISLLIIPGLWILDALLTGWGRVFIQILVTLAVLAATVLIVEYKVWEVRQMMLFIATFTIARSLVTYLGLSRIPYHQAISELLAILVQLVWTLAGYWIISSRGDGGTLYVLVNFIVIFVSSSLQQVLLIWRNAKLSNITQKLKLVSTWSLDEHVIMDVIEDGDVGTLRPTQRAIMFGDIRGFTAFTEGNNPDRVIEILSMMYHDVDGVVLKYQGSKPEFIADEFITYFSSPQDAVDCAVELVQKVNRSLRKYDLGVGIGIDYGGILEGIIGSSNSKKYTVIGKHVNTAARLQAKAGLGEILISEAVKNLADGYQVRLIPGVKLKGVSSRLRVYSLKYEIQTPKLFVPRASMIKRFYNQLFN